MSRSGCPSASAHQECLPAKASLSRAGVIGNRVMRTPVASNTALAITAPVVVIEGSPPPCGASSSLRTSTASTRGAPLNFVMV